MYTIKITKTEVQERLTPRTWEFGGPDGKFGDGTHGYTPETLYLTTDILDMTVKCLDVAEVVRTILDNSEPE